MLRSWRSTLQLLRVSKKKLGASEVVSVIRRAVNALKCDMAAKIWIILILMKRTEQRKQGPSDCLSRKGKKIDTEKKYYNFIVNVQNILLNYNPILN